MYCVYKISNGEFSYYGSTNNFERRMKEHRHDCSWNTEKNKLYEKKRYKIMREHGGWNAFTKEIVESSIDTKLNARQREEHYRKIDGNLNVFKCYITPEEQKAKDKERKNAWLQKNKARALAKARERYKKNKAKKAEYYQKNKAKHNASQKVYYQLPSTKVKKKASYQKRKAYLSEKLICECGRTIARYNKTEHIKTKIHKRLMAEI